MTSDFEMKHLEKTLKDHVFYRELAQIALNDHKIVSSDNTTFELAVPNMSYIPISVTMTRLDDGAWKLAGQFGTFHAGGVLTDACDASDVACVFLEACFDHHNEGVFVNRIRYDRAYREYHGLSPFTKNRKNTTKPINA